MKRLLFAAIAIAATGTMVAENATLELGNYSTTTDYLDGSVNERGLPVNYCYQYSGGQIVYPYEIVKEIADKNGEITSISFRYMENGSFFDGDFEGQSKVWIQATDLQSIPQNENNKGVWTPYADGSMSSISIDYSITYGENEYELTYTFATPVKLAPGQSLLVTAASEITNDIAANPDDFSCFSFKAGSDKYASYYTSDTKSFEQDYAAGNVNMWTSSFVPVAKIAYTYVDKLPQLDAPVFTPQSGTALGPDDKVTITAAEGATILYTLEKDGTPETTYTEPIAITANTTITAIAKAEGYEDSDAATASYTLKLTEAPKFAIPTDTELGTNETVIITAPEGAKVLYTLSADGEPDQEYPETGISLTADATVKAVAVAEGCYSSKIVEATYTVSDKQALIIGGYYDTPDADNTFIGTNWYNAPIIPTYANSASQLLYLPSELSGLNKLNKLHSVSFRFTNETSFSSYQSNVKLYIQQLDVEAFEYDNLNSKYSWFETPLDTPVAEIDYEIDYADYYYQCGELTFQLPDEGVAFEQGKSLLITVVNEAPTPLDNSEYPQFLKYNTTTHRAGIFASDKCDYATSLKESPYISQGSNFYSMMTDNNQPCVKIFFTEEKEEGINAVGSETIDNDTVEYYNLSGVKVTVAPAPGIYIVRRGATFAKEIVK